MHVCVKTLIAIPVCGDQVSTVCDFARSLLIVTTGGGRVVSRRELPLLEESPLQRAARIGHEGVQVLICGAISRPLAVFIAQRGIGLVPFVSGPVDDVLAAWLGGRLADHRYLLPGSSPAARRRWRGGRGGGGRGGRPGW
ncbi:MAG: NifB/NifX family molybdenum-iron cluster-binding protein [Candidatus Krumholzibacteria bacterium]|nr:NifB/NifX family molybdenum-iron cluster-binding protein [Candidatus Krumholzibacteria bacterium]